MPEPPQKQIHWPLHFRSSSQDDESSGKADEKSTNSDSTVPKKSTAKATGTAHGGKAEDPKKSIRPENKGKQKENGSSSSASKRPGLPERSDTVHSQYVEMLLQQDEIPRLHNILAAAFVWLLLAGFLVFPGTFTSLEESIEEAEDLSDEAADAILDGVRNVPLVVVGAVACGIAAAGMLWLVWRHRRNYVWLLNRLFLPGTGNSVAGLISTLINVYSSQGGSWSIMARVTAIVEGGCLLACGGLFAFTEAYLLRKVRRKHGTFYQGGPAGEEHEEGFMEKVERKAKEPGMEPGSVV